MVVWGEAEGGMGRGMCPQGWDRQCGERGPRTGVLRWCLPKPSRWVQGATWGDPGHIPLHPVLSWCTCPANSLLRASDQHSSQTSQP